MLGQTFVDEVKAFEEEFGNDDGEISYIELLGFFKNHYANVCAADLIERFSILPEVPSIINRRPDGPFPPG
jgi:hypothetical protein